ncbi:unnamed protein product [Cuscuta epithymum]|uniref:F-box domain-containing protein n=1 Tax=Cuscuta epithymum TaxID=186058 RepID=A0AAV0DLE5_9ASTE|nr:unnamed protein product [Cuscuta epithymum]
MIWNCIFRMEEILSRLPAKTLMRFKCVSKRWNSLISGPAFANLQLRRANRDGSRLFLTTAPPQSLDYNNGAFRKLSYPAAMMKGGPSSDFIPTWILGSCNGLIGFRGSSLRYGYAGEFLWNPTTGDYKELPDAPHLQCLIYWPTLSGVGYNDSRDDYGVLHGFTKTQSKGTRKTILQLYTLKTGRWRQIQDEAAPDLVSYLKGRSISWNGDMFWLGYKPNGVHCMGSFDLKEEKFKEIQLPLLGDKSSGKISLGISGNSLCVFCKGMESCFEAWALKLDANGGSCWNRLFSFPLDTFWGPRDTLLCLTKEGEILMDSKEILMDSNEFRMYIYNLKDRKIKYLTVDNHIDKFSKPVFYIESLVSPNN